MIYPSSNWEALSSFNFVLESYYLAIAQCFPYYCYLSLCLSLSYFELIDFDYLFIFTNLPYACLFYGFKFEQRGLLTVWHTSYWRRQTRFVGLLAQGTSSCSYLRILLRMYSFENGRMLIVNGCYCLPIEYHPCFIRQGLT